MKTVKNILVSAFILCNLVAFSANKHTNTIQVFSVVSFGSQTINDIRINEIVGEIGTSQEIKNLNQGGFVLISYHIVNGGAVVVDQLNTNNPYLGENIKNKVECGFF